MQVDRRALVRHVVRLGPWRSIAGVGVAFGAVTVWQATEVEAADGLVTWLRLGAVLLAAAVATTVEDVGAVIAATTPFGRFRRRVLGVALPALAAVAVWLLVAGVALLVVDRSEMAPPFPVGGLALEPAALVATGVALGAVIARSGDLGSGSRASVATVVAVLLTLGHPRSIMWLWAPPGSGADWSAGRLHWMIVGVVSAAVFGLLSADAARRSLVPRRPARSWTER